MLIEKDIWVNLEDNRGELRLFKIGQGKKYNWRKHKFELSILIGKPYYTFYKIDHEDKISQVDQSYFSPNDEEQVEEITKTNKEIFDRNESQKLKEDDIYQLKQQEEGEDIIKKLIENSETFEKKTEYSQAKYLKRKKEKYLFCFIVKPTTIENVQKTWYKDNPARINYFREDTLAIFMQFAGINQKANILMFDNSYGMGLAAVAERLDGEGILSLISHGKHTLRDLVPFQSMNFNEEIIKSIQLVESYDQFLESYSHLLICGEFNLKEIFEKVNDKLTNGGVVVVFSSFLEKLGELAELMNKSQKYTQVVLVDTFLRYHQVLLNRTHPRVDMDAYGGYVLQAYKIE